jgi:hypothetical protein
LIGKGKLIFSTSIIFGGKNKKERKSLEIPILFSFFALAKRKQLFCVEVMVPWMSGLVSGLQNRVRRFESARNLLVIENSVLRIENYFYF